MPEALVLLPGWGLGPDALTPLANALQAVLPQARVVIEPLPTAPDESHMLAELDRVVPAGAWLLGWSLGGMLAVALAHRRGPACPGVITLASNACFVAREGWPTAMDNHTFSAFAGQCAAAPASTLKRFGLLCAQGSADARDLAKRLVPATTLYADPTGLALLAGIDNRTALASLAAPQLHLFAKADALVPERASQAVAQLAPRARIGTLEGSHALPVEALQAVVAQVSSFIKDCIHG